LGSGGLSWAAVDPDTNATAAVGQLRACPTGGANYQFYTNDSTIFAAANRTIAGSSCPGIQMLVGGHYLVQAMLVPLTHFPDATGYAIGPADNADADESTFYMRANQRLTPAGEAAFCVSAGSGRCQTISWENIQSLDDGFVSAPATFVAGGTNISGSGSITFTTRTIIYYLDSDTTFIG